jgi:hypothetical protein
MKNWTYQDLKQAGHIIFECIAGSQAYGTALPTSDEDRRYVYMLPLEELLGLTHARQVNDDGNDIMGYEIGRFLELLAEGNPTIIELAFMPLDTVVYKDPIFDLVLAQRDKFLTKRLANSLGGYASQQIQKANGQDKMMNWEKDKVARKTPLDFCYVTRPEGGSIPFSKFVADINEGVSASSLNRVTQRHFGVVPVPHAKDVYDLYYSFTHPEWLAGLVSEEGDSNALRVSSVPKGIQPIRQLIYNQDGYSQHCKDYQKYQHWLTTRNEARWVESQVEGQRYDAKNIMHCVRIVQMAREIASGQGLNVRRPNREELLEIRRGNAKLPELLAWAEAEIKPIKALFAASALPDEVGHDFRDQLLLNVRLAYYQRASIPRVRLDVTLDN